MKLNVLLLCIEVAFSMLNKFDKLKISNSFRAFTSITTHIPQTLSPEPEPSKLKSIPINIYVDSDVRKYLNMRNSDRKARVFMPQDQNVNVISLKGIVEKKFTSLRDQPYLIRYCLPGIMPQPRTLSSDSDAEQIVNRIHESGTLQLYVEGRPGEFPPPKFDYLLNMPDPSVSASYTVLSFYKFYKIEDPDQFSTELFELWKPFKMLGRVYVAEEGINAQCSVPSNILDKFKLACETLPMFKDGIYLNIDHELSRDDYEMSPPFKALHIRVRDQIVADGLTRPLDLGKSSGRVISPADWHQELDNPDAIVLDCRNSYESEIGLFQNAIPLNTTFFRESWDALKEVLKDKPKDSPIMTYCTGGIRCVKINAFLEQELGFTNTGRLQGGVISYSKQLDSFVDKKHQQESSEQVNVASRDLVSSESSRPIYLSRDIGSESKFKGVNYVFDDRMGARITSDVLAECETCGTSCDTFTNCENTECHIRFIQCDRCNPVYQGCCCKACSITHTELQEKVAERERNEQIKREKIYIRNSNMVPRSGRKAISDKFNPGSSQEDLHTTTDSSGENNPRNIKVDKESLSAFNQQLEALSRYAEIKSSPEPELLYNLRKETEVAFGEVASRMLSGHLQGRLLSLLAGVKQPSCRVLELGTFTGYSTLCFAESVGVQGKVITCEIDPKAAEIAQKYFQLSSYNNQIELYQFPADKLLDKLSQENQKFDLVFIDANKKAYRQYICRLLGLSHIDDDEVGGDGGVIRVDAKQVLLNDGAFILIDNTLWKGCVLSHEEELRAFAPVPEMFENPERMNILSKSMHDFNNFVKRLSGSGSGSSLPLATAAATTADINNNSIASFQVVMLPFRDGLTLLKFNLK